MLSEQDFTCGNRKCDKERHTLQRNAPITTNQSMDCTSEIAFLIIVQTVAAATTGESRERTNDVRALFTSCTSSFSISSFAPHPAKQFEETAGARARWQENGDSSKSAGTKRSEASERSRLRGRLRGWKGGKKAEKGTCRDNVNDTSRAYYDMPLSSPPPREKVPVVSLLRARIHTHTHTLCPPRLHT